MTQLELEMLFHGQPFRRNDGKDHRVPQTAVSVSLVTPQDAILLCAEAFDGAAACMIEEARSEFHCDTVQSLESVLKQHQLALRVDRRALGRSGIPRRADLNTAMSRVNVHVRGHANHFVPGEVPDGPWQHRTCLLKSEAALDLSAHSIW